MDIDLDLLPSLVSFALVVETGSFSAAADRLNTTRSAVSKQVKRLERAWDVRLLSRTTRAVSLTEPGRLAYEHALQVSRLSELAREAATSLIRTPRGRLRMTASVAFGHMVVLPLLPSFLDRHPDVEVDLVLEDRFVDIVEEGFDLAVRITPNPPDLLVARELGSVRSLLCASPRLRNIETIRHPSDLDAFPAIASMAQQRDRHWHFNRGGETCDIVLRSRVTMNTSEGRSTLARLGHGVAVLPDYVCRALVERGELVVLLPDWTVRMPFGEVIWGIRVPEKRALPKVTAMTDFLLGELSKTAR
jgi:DNA-binding transcriptional LysR family regulator